MERLAGDNGYPFYPGTNFGDALSMRTINASSDATAADADAVFDAPAVVVHSADGGAMDAVVAAFAAAAGPGVGISRHAIDAATLRTWDRAAAAGGADGWREDKPDLLTIIQRASLPEDVEAFAEWQVVPRAHVAIGDDGRRRRAGAAWGARRETSSRSATT